MKPVTHLPNAAVPIRHVQFDFDESKAAKYCWNNNAWGSAYILTFSALIPAGERFVIEAVRAFRDTMDDPELKARATSLIGQEATHSKIHGEFNRMYELKGLPVNKMERISERFYLDMLMPLLPEKTQLAIACGIEHVTAVMAEKTFGDDLATMANFDQATRDFLLWHLLEELEHKSIAYDMYEAVDGSYLHRIAAFLLIWGVSVPLGLYSVDQFLKVPGFNQGRKKNRRGIRFWGSEFLAMTPKLLNYFRPDFHPDKYDTTAMLEQWRDKLFGDNGQLSSNVTKTLYPKVQRQRAKQMAAL